MTDIISKQNEISSFSSVPVMQHVSRWISSLCFWNAAVKANDFFKLMQSLNAACITLQLEVT